MSMGNELINAVVELNAKNMDNHFYINGRINMSDIFDICRSK